LTRSSLRPEPLAAHRSSDRSAFPGIGLSAQGKRRRNTPNRPGTALKVALVMARKDMPYLSLRPPP